MADSPTQSTNVAGGDKTAPPGVPEPTPDNVLRGNAEAKAFDQVGVSGLKAFSGLLFEEYLPELYGDKAQKVYRTMGDDPIVSAVLQAIALILRAVDWRVEPADNGADGGNFSAQAEQEAEFAQGLLDDMSHTWEDTIGEILSMLQYGWSYLEIVLKRRMGLNQDDPAMRSKFDDGRIGIRKLPLRSQDSRLKWAMQEDGGINGMWQLPPQGGPLLYIPIERALLFRTTSKKNSPEGVSILRACYRPWFLKRGVEDHESIGIERELAGLPVVYMPKAYLAPTASADKVTVRQQMEALARDVKLNSQAGVVLPSETFQNPDGTWSSVPMVKLELLSSSGSKRAIDTDPVVKRYNRLIAMAALADFLTLGDDKGSYALSANKSELFLRSCESYLNQIASVLNRFLLPRIFSYNGIDPSLVPQIKPGRLAPVDLAELGAYLQSLAGAGAPLFPNQELSEYLADVAGLPEPPEDVGLLAKPGAMPRVGQINPETGEPITPDEQRQSDFEQSDIQDLSFMNNNTSATQAQKRFFFVGAAKDKPVNIAKMRKFNQNHGDDGRFAMQRTVLKYNQNHDEQGRFTFGSGTGGIATALYNKNADPNVKPDDIYNRVNPHARDAAAQLEASMATRVPSDRPVSEGGYMQEDGTYTPERQALHEQLVNDALSPERIDAATPAPGERPTMTMLGGRGGSGKSFLTSPDGPVDPSKTIVLNSDDFKGPLAKADGLDERYAALYHEESDHVLKMTSSRAKALGLNVAFDSTMKTESTAAARMLEYQAAGYDINGHYMHTAPQIAAERSIGRFYKNGQANGRYVPPSIILGNTKNEQNFDKLSPNFKSWTIWDNNGTSGKPVLIAKGGK